MINCARVIDAANVLKLTLVTDNVFECNTSAIIMYYTGFLVLIGPRKYLQNYCILLRTCVPVYHSRKRFKSNSYCFKANILSRWQYLRDFKVTFLFLIELHIFLIHHSMQLSILDRKVPRHFKRVDRWLIQMTFYHQSYRTDHTRKKTRKDIRQGFYAYVSLSFVHSIWWN